MSFKGYRITSNFGYRIHPISKVRKLHGGVDLVKNHNDPIYAFRKGTVSFAGRNNQGFGNLVIVNEPNGYRNFYAHLNRINVKKGQKVTTNTMIGRQGATGNVTGSHLHFEVRNKNNIAVDPIKYINSTGNSGKQARPKKSINQMAQEVIAGKHGTGHANRRKSLGISQSEYNKVRAEVNRLSGVKKGLTVEQMANKIINDKNAPTGHKARRKWLGIDNATYQKVRARVNQKLS